MQEILCGYCMLDVTSGKSCKGTAHIAGSMHTSGMSVVDHHKLQTKVCVYKQQNGMPFWRRGMHPGGRWPDSRPPAYTAAPWWACLATEPSCPCHKQRQTPILFLPKKERRASEARQSNTRVYVEYTCEYMNQNMSAKITLTMQCLTMWHI